MKRKTIKLSNLSESLKREVRKHMKEGKVDLGKLPNKIKGLVESEMAGISDDVSRRRHIKVTFEDGNTIETPINGTKREIEDYYVGKYFNMGVEDDKMVKALSVEFLDDQNLNEEANVGVRELWNVLGIKDSRELPSSPRMNEVLAICKANGMSGKMQYWFDHFQGTLNVVNDGGRVVIGVEDGEISPFSAGKVYPLN